VGSSARNPVSAVDRPREPRRRWAILSPDEVGRVERAFAELAEEAEGEERASREQARVVFLTVVSAGLRRGEILGLRWRHVSLADPACATLRVRETWVRGAPDTPKSEKSERTIALGERLAAELFSHRGRTRSRATTSASSARNAAARSTGAPLDTVTSELRSPIAELEAGRPSSRLPRGRGSATDTAS
jgi:integrase